MTTRSNTLLSALAKLTQPYVLNTPPTLRPFILQDSLPGRGELVLLELLEIPRLPHQYVLRLVDLLRSSGVVPRHVVIHPFQHRHGRDPELSGRHEPADEKVLTSIDNGVLKTIVAQFNADHLLTERPRVSALARESLIERARDFNIVLEQATQMEAALREVSSPEWQSSMNSEPKTLTSQQLRRAREAAVMILNTVSYEEALRIFTVVTITRSKTDNGYWLRLASATQGV